jgi:hypothetical protein
MTESSDPPGAPPASESLAHLGRKRMGIVTHYVPSESSRDLRGKAWLGRGHDFALLRNSSLARKWAPCAQRKEDSWLSRISD